MIISLVKDGLFSKEEGAKRLSISVIELDEYISANEQKEYCILKVLITRMVNKRNSMTKGINLQYVEIAKDPNAK